MTISTLIVDLFRRHATAVIFVSHDLAVMRTVTHRAMVVKHGRIVETGATDGVLTDPGHQCTP